MRRILLYMIVLLMMLYAMTSCNPYGSQIPEKLNGCWVSRDNGRWEYGFFEEFAICNNNFWRYYSVSDTEIVLYSKGAAAHTKNNGKKLGLALDSTAITLKISFEGDSILNVNGKRYWQFNTPYELSGTSDGFSQIAHNDFEKLIDYPNTQPDTADFDATAQGNAVVMIYERNTARGLGSFARRFEEVNQCDLYRFYNPDDTVSLTKFVGKLMGGFVFYTKNAFPLYMSTQSSFSETVDFDEHYGLRHIFDVQVNGLAEFTLNFNASFYDPRTYIIEPGDTLMLFFDRESASAFGPLVYNHHHIMGTNERFCREVDAFYNDIFWNVHQYNKGGFNDDWNRQQMSDTAYFEQRLKRYAEDSALLESYLTNCPIPMSKKFVRFSRNQLLYNFAADIANNAFADDYLMQKFGRLNEDDLYLSADALNFVKKWILCHNMWLNGNMPVTRENVEQHPDGILYGDYNQGAFLIDAKVLRDMGLSDKFIEDFRYSVYSDFIWSSKYHNDGLRDKLEDFEEDNLLRNFTNETYLENVKGTIESYKRELMTKRD